MIHALRDAAIIVAVILILFLLNVRTTLITLTAIPLSLAAGLQALNWMDMTINVMTLGGLAIAVGSLVDDAIIGMENAFRRLRENAALDEAERRSKRTVIASAIHEVGAVDRVRDHHHRARLRPALVPAGDRRALLPAARASRSSCRSSPRWWSRSPSRRRCAASCSTTGSKAGEERDGFLVRWLKRIYEPTVELAVRWRKAVLGGALGLTAAGALAGLDLRHVVPARSSTRAPSRWDCSRRPAPRSRPATGWPDRSRSNCWSSRGSAA